MKHNKPEDATHEWLAAKVIPFTFQRKYYKFEDGEWYSFSVHNQWVKTNNDNWWFLTEIIQGYFVAIPKDPALDKD